MRAQAEAGWVPSLFDRLQEREASRGDVLNVAAFHESVRRDMEALLNARLSPVSPVARYVPSPLDQSLLAYGLPDLCTLNLLNADARQAFARVVMETLRRFEPRFQRVAVTVEVPDDVAQQRVRFRINAVLHRDSAPVVFDSHMEPSTRVFHLGCAA